MDLMTHTISFLFLQIRKSSISQMVMIQMLKNGMQPVQKSAVDFFFLQILGEGCFSTVRLVRSECTISVSYMLRLF